MLESGLQTWQKHISVKAKRRMCPTKLSNNIITWCASLTNQRNLIKIIGRQLTGSRHIHIGREMSCCTCSLIKSTSWEGGIQREIENERKKETSDCTVYDRFYYTSAYNKSLQLKYLEAFIGYNQSAAGYHSRFLKWDICSASLWFNAAAEDTDGWDRTKVVLAGLLLPPSGHNR